jgi:hypothetical protein
MDMMLLVLTPPAASCLYRTYTGVTRYHAKTRGLAKKPSLSVIGDDLIGRPGQSTSQTNRRRAQRSARWRCTTRGEDS